MQLKTFLCLVVGQKQIVMVGYHGVVRVMRVGGRGKFCSFSTFRAETPPLTLH